MMVSWDPPSPPGNTVGYTVSYNLSTATDIDISDVSTTSTTITGLENKNYYTISIILAENTTGIVNELKPSTVYVIEVAAINGAGTGVYGMMAISTLSCKLEITYGIQRYAQ